MEMIKDYQGFQQTISTNGRSLHQTYKGFKEDCINFMQGYTIGQISENGDGSLKNIEFQQSEGPYWTVTLEWGIEVNSNGDLTPEGSSYGPTQSTVTVRMLSVPL